MEHMLEITQLRLSFNLFVVLGYKLFQPSWQRSTALVPMRTAVHECVCGRLSLAADGVIIHDLCVFVDSVNKTEMTRQILTSSVASVTVQSLNEHHFP